MGIVEYTFIRFRRRMAMCLTIAFVSICLSALICVINISISDRRNGLSEVKQNMDVTCTVSNEQGTKTDGLFISPDYIEMMTNSSDPIHAYVRELSLKKTIKYSVPNTTKDQTDDKKTLIGISRREASPALSYENSTAVTFESGYGDSAFGEKGLYCLAGEALSPYISTDQSGAKILDLTIHFSTASNAVKPRSYRFVVVGSVANGNPWAVYSNWDSINRIYEAEGETPDAESMAFTLADNNLIEEFRALASNYFIAPDYAQVETQNKLALTINDGIYNQTVSSYEKSILILSILKPFILFCSAGIGCFISFLVVRSRMKEFAILRSMGTSRKSMMMQGILETAVLCIIGAFLGFLLILLWRHSAFSFIGAEIALYILCYEIGSFVSIYQSLSIPTINLLRERQ